MLSKIDEILAWEKSSDRDRDTQFVELGRYLCEVRAGQYWRLDNLKSFDEYLERKFPESQAQGLLPDGHSRTPAEDSETRSEVGGMDKATELVKVARRDREQFDCATWLHKATDAAQRRVQTRSGKAPDGAGDGAVGDPLFQGLQEPVAGH